MENRKATKFIKLLSKQIKECSSDKEAFKDYEAVKIFLLDAVSEKETDIIAKEIKNNQDIYAAKLHKLLNKREKKQKTKNLESAHGVSKFSFNLLLKPKEITVNQNASNKTSNNANRMLLAQVLSDIPQDDIKEILDSLDGGTPITEILLIACGAITSFQCLVNTMLLCLTEMLGKVENLNTTNANACRTLCNQLHNFLSVCHTRRNALALDENSVGETESTRLDDVTASLLAIYIDLYMLSHRTSDKKQQCSRALCKFCCFLTNHNKQYRTDVLLQLCSVGPEDGEIMAPFLMRTFEDTPAAGDIPNYVKYVLSARILHKVLKDAFPEVILTKCINIAAPRKFMKWLEEEDASLIEEMPDDRKFQGRTITEFLLKDASDDTVNKILDILTVDDVTEMAGESHASKKDNSLEDEDGDGEKDGLGEELFFIDTGKKSNDEKSATDFFFIDKSGNDQTKAEPEIYRLEDMDKETFKKMVTRQDVYDDEVVSSYDGEVSDSEENTIIKDNLQEVEILCSSDDNDEEATSDESFKTATEASIMEPTGVKEFEETSTSPSNDQISMDKVVNSGDISTDDSNEKKLEDVHQAVTETDTEVFDLSKMSTKSAPADNPKTKVSKQGRKPKSDRRSSRNLSVSIDGRDENVDDISPQKTPRRRGRKSLVSADQCDASIVTPQKMNSVSTQSTCTDVPIQEDKSTKKTSITVVNGSDKLLETTEMASVTPKGRRGRKSKVSNSEEKLNPLNDSQYSKEIQESPLSLNNSKKTTTRTKQSPRNANLSVKGETLDLKELSSPVTSPRRSSRIRTMSGCSEASGSEFSDAKSHLSSPVGKRLHQVRRRVSESQNEASRRKPSDSQTNEISPEVKKPLNASRRQSVDLNEEGSCEDGSKPPSRKRMKREEKEEKTPVTPARRGKKGNKAETPLSSKNKKRYSLRNRE